RPARLQGRTIICTCRTDSASPLVSWVKVSRLPVALAKILYVHQPVEVIILSPHNSTDALRSRIYNTVRKRQLVVDANLRSSKCQRRVQIDHRSLFHRRSTPAMPKNRRHSARCACVARSHAIALSAHRGIDTLKKAAHALERAHRDELDPIVVRKRLDLLPRLQPQPLPDGERDHDLKFGRNGYYVH